MKKNILIGVLTTSVLLGGALAVGAVNKESSTEKLSKPSEQLMTADEAKKIALTVQDGKVEGIDRERNGEQVFYEVEVEKNNEDYDIYVNAATGEVQSLNDDVYDDDSSDDNDDQDKMSDVSTNDAKLISKEKAVAIAENATKGKMTEVEKDEDDGRITYEIKLKTDRGEAEVEIDASTGEVEEIDFED
ncbi:PepSY domain-containing protein [Metabacillus herbersteinensis]|uniref:PepSY domain-containing protein n=1 Tax=Metabacillus herbersteinensis TaxID=283816 RepID=A0ABV6GL58_9BACI